MSRIQQPVINEKIRKGGSLNEGRRPIIFQTYEKMCELIYVGGDDDYLFAHTFITMEWDLMARSDNCVNMNLNIFQCQDD